MGKVRTSHTAHFEAFQQVFECRHALQMTPGQPLKITPLGQIFLECIYNCDMGMSDLPEMYACSYTFQANSVCPCHNYEILHNASPPLHILIHNKKIHVIIINIYHDAF